ncbi:TIM barrel protein [Candidatus Micrarchaeota archaeon]|nr:TIM barrel protein [Candidatus Micrarchaeota archaeon]
MGFIFGPSGIPLRCKGDTIEGIECARDIGLGALEMGFVQGVRMKEDTAARVGEVARKQNIAISVHAPYYINLLSEEKEKRDASRVRIFESARIGGIASAKRIVFHPAFYGKTDRKLAIGNMIEQVGMILDEMKNSKIEGVVLAPECMGKIAQFGTIEENFSVANEFGMEKVNPCVDFGHLHARENGKLKTKADFLDKIYEIEGFGKKYLQAMHIHFEGIEYTEKGERRHLPISSKSPDFNLLAGALIEKNCSGTIISESPEIENDALEMQRIYSKIALGK